MIGEDLIKILSENKDLPIKFITNIGLLGNIEHTFNGLSYDNCSATVGYTLTDIPFYLNYERVWIKSMDMAEIIEIIYDVKLKYSKDDKRRQFTYSKELNEELNKLQWQKTVIIYLIPH